MLTHDTYYYSLHVAAEDLSQTYSLSEYPAVYHTWHPALGPIHTVVKTQVRVQSAVSHARG